MAWFFLSFETFRIFRRNIWHGSQNSIHLSRVKIAEKKFFFVFFPDLFQFLSRNFSDFWPKNCKNLSKLPSTCPEEQFVAWNFILSFETFRIFCRNIWHGSQNSIYVSRVKIAEKTVFYCFISRIFSNFEQNIFRILAKKLQKFVKTNFSVSTGTTCGFKLFLKVLNRFGLSAETFGMVLKFLSTCPDENLRKKYFFYSSFLIFFRILSEKLFRVLAKKLQEFVKTNFYVSRGTICGLKFYFKFWNVSDFLQKHLAWFSKFYLRVQSKNCGKNRFLLFYFQNFFEFWAKYFQNFGQKTSKICEN